MQPTYICSEQHYNLMLDFASFLSLKMLFDAGYKLEPFDYKVYSHSSNHDIVKYVLTAIWGEENIQIDDMEVDMYQMVLYRVRIKDFYNLNLKTLQEIEKQAAEVTSSIENNSMWGEELFEAWYTNKDGFEILMYPVNVDTNFTKEILSFAGKVEGILQEAFLQKEDSHGHAA